MNCCSARYAAAERQFDRATAERDLRRYRRRGPDRTTRLLLESLKGNGVHGASLVDVGAGIGVLTLELLRAGAREATLVDAAPAYVEVAEREAARTSAGRVRVVLGDFAAPGLDVPPADIVTLDRVVCCYPAYERLLERSLACCRRLYAMSYPRDRWYVRWVVALQNLLRRLTGTAFRTFVHPPDAMQRIVARAGFRLLRRTETLVWRVDVFARSEGHAVR